MTEENGVTAEAPEIPIEEALEVAWAAASKAFMQAFEDCTAARVSPALVMAMLEQHAAINYLIYKQDYTRGVEEAHKQAIDAWYEDVIVQTQVRILNVLRLSNPTFPEEILYAGVEHIVEAIKNSEYTGDLDVQPIDVH